MQTPHSCGGGVLKLANLTGIVTGACHGVGRAVVQRLVEEGVTIGMFDTQYEEGKELENELKEQDKEVYFFRVDIANKEMCFMGVQKFLELTDGRLHFLVNAAVNRTFKGLDAEKIDWEGCLGVNVMGCANMVQACFSPMVETLRRLSPDGERRSSSSGRTPPNCSIVNVCSDFGWTIGKNRWTYDCTMAAILRMTRCMAEDLSDSPAAPARIRVNSVSTRWSPTDEEQRIDDASRKPGGRRIVKTKVDLCTVTSLILFLLSPEALDITGEDFQVDGGKKALFAATPDDMQA